MSPLPITTLRFPVIMTALLGAEVKAVTAEASEGAELAPSAGASPCISASATPQPPQAPGEHKAQPHQAAPAGRGKRNNETHNCSLPTRRVIKPHTENEQKESLLFTYE